MYVEYCTCTKTHIFRIAFSSLGLFLRLITPIKVKHLLESSEYFLPFMLFECITFTKATKHVTNKSLFRFVYIRVIYLYAGLERYFGKYLDI